jgi:hypothetical protein
MVLEADDAMKALKTTTTMTVLILLIAASIPSIKSLTALSTRMTMSTERPIINMRRRRILNQCYHHHRRSTWSTITTTTNRYRRLSLSSSSSYTPSNSNNHKVGEKEENARTIHDSTPSPTRRPIIVGYHLDEEQHWVAELECGHFQHVRHDPPMVERPWVLTLQGRTKFLGYPLVCKKCARQAPPDRVHPPQQ